MKKRRLFLFFLLLGILVTTARWWTDCAEEQIHAAPMYEKKDILPILMKEKFTEEDYNTLFLQTGLARVGVDQLIEENRRRDILRLQDLFFEDVDSTCERYCVIVHTERLCEGTERANSKRAFLPAVRTGDVLVTFNGHVLGWRCGHAALVTDAKKGITLEAVAMGRKSEFWPIEEWATYPGFVQLRLKDTDEETLKQITTFAEEHLEKIPYRLPSLVQKDCSKEEVSGTHCAHLVWYAFARYGYDLNSDGGHIVTPRDIFDSDLLEVVQVYGLPVEECR